MKNVQQGIKNKKMHVKMFLNNYSAEKNQLKPLKAHSKDRRFLAIESPLKMMKNAIYFT